MATNHQENIYEQIEETNENIYEKPYENINNNPEPKYENQGASQEIPEEPLYSTINQPSPDYMDTRGTSQEEEEQPSPPSEPGEQLESEIMVASLPNGDVYGSSSFEDNGDPCDDQPSLVHDDLLMAYSLPEDGSPEPEEVVDYSLKDVENSAVEEPAAVPDPNQPNIALFVKVRAVGLWRLHKRTWIFILFKERKKDLKLALCESEGQLGVVCNSIHISAHLWPLKTILKTTWKWIVKPLFTRPVSF